MAYALPDMGGARAVDMSGSHEMKSTCLPAVIEGEDHLAITISKPGASSDVSSMSISIREENGERLLCGQKTWVSGLREATAAVVWTKFPEGLGTIVLDFGRDASKSVKHSKIYSDMFRARSSSRRHGPIWECSHSEARDLQTPARRPQLGADRKCHSIERRGSL